MSISKFLAISGNTKSVIREEKYGENIVVEDTPGIVSCDELLPFWIRWYQGVEVGRGPIAGSNAFMKYHDPVGKAITTISISTGWHSAGEWRISNAPGMKSLSKWFICATVVFVTKNV